MNEDNFNPQFRRPAVNKDPQTNDRFDGQPGSYYPPVSAPLAPSPQQQDYYRRLSLAKDEKELGQLALGYKIYGGIHAAISCIPFIHLFVGIMMVTGGFGNDKGAPPVAFGWFFIVIASIFIVLGWTLSICNFYVGKFLKERRKYMFCFVMSCINCASMPLGTILGVFSLVLLTRESVKELFGHEVKLKQ